MYPPDDASVLCPLSVLLSRSSWCGGGCASGRLKVRCCWKGREVKLLLIGRVSGATASSVGGRRKGVVCIRLFKVVPTAPSAQHPPRGGNRAASHPSQAGRDDNIIKFLQGPSDAVTNHHSHPLAPLSLFDTGLCFLEGIRKHYGKDKQ